MRKPLCPGDAALLVSDQLASVLAAYLLNSLPSVCGFSPHCSSLTFQSPAYGVISMW